MQQKRYDKVKNFFSLIHSNNSKRTNGSKFHSCLCKVTALLAIVASCFLLY